MSEEFCVWDCCDQAGSYCESHAYELVDPLGKLSKIESLEAENAKLRGSVRIAIDALDRRRPLVNRAVSVLRGALEQQS